MDEEKAEQRDRLGYTVLGRVKFKTMVGGGVVKTVATNINELSF